MAKVISVIEKTAKSGNHYYSVALEKDGQDIGATAFEKLAKGDEIEDSRIKLDKDGTSWIIESLNRKGGGKQWVRNDELQTAQKAMELVTQCALGGLINPPLTETVLVDNGVLFGRAILMITKILKGDAPVQTPKTKLIKTSKELFHKTTEELQLTVEELRSVKGFVDAVNAEDYDKAYELAKAAAGVPAC